MNLLVTQKERGLELTDGKPLRGRQILCMIIDHYQINANDKDYKNITDLNNVSLRGDDVLGFITKWDDVLMRFDQTKLPTDEQLLLLLERQIVNSASFKINYTLFQNEKVDNPGSAKTTYDYLHRQIHNHTRRDRADEIAREYCESSRTRVAPVADGEKRHPGTCKYMMRFGQCTFQGCLLTHDTRWAGFYKKRSTRSSSRGSQGSNGKSKGKKGDKGKPKSKKCNNK